MKFNQRRYISRNLTNFANNNDNMGNSQNRETVFKFKQFDIKNEYCAMKVGTDGVLLGAWADVSSSSQIVDVGSGSGLISLMLAQRCDASIIGVEIDEIAVKESEENILRSPWKNRISIINDDFTNLSIDQRLRETDHVISNPPFFNNGIVSPDAVRAKARHCEMLSYNSLIEISSKLLKQKGKLSLISPAEYVDDIIASASFNRMYVSRYTEVYSKTVSSKPKRILWELSLVDCPTQKGRLAIRDISNEYTVDYINLTKDFYINM